MEEDFEKTIILCITVLIVWCFFISNNINNINNPQIYFGLFLTLFFICLIQRQYLKKWTDDENKTDYTLVYYFYNLLTVGIFLYLLFILGNPKLKILKGGSYNSNMINPDMLNIDISNQESIKDKILQFIRNVLNKGIGGLASGFSLYTRFWKKLIYKIIGTEETNI